MKKKVPTCFVTKKYSIRIRLTDISSRFWGILFLERLFKTELIPVIDFQDVLGIQKHSRHVRGSNGISSGDLVMRKNKPVIFWPQSCVYLSLAYWVTSWRYTSGHQISEGLYFFSSLSIPEIGKSQTMIMHTLYTPQNVRKMIRYQKVSFAVKTWLWGYRDWRDLSKPPVGTLHCTQYLQCSNWLCVNSGSRYK